MSSLDNEEESNCSSTSSRNGEISRAGSLKKFKRNNISIRDFKIMLVNGLSKAKKEACLTSVQKKDGKFSAVCNSASVDDDETLVSNNKSLVNNDTIFSNGNQASDFVPTESEFEIDDKGSIDENSFELRIDNDEEDETPEIKLDLKSDQDNKNVIVRSKNNVGVERSSQLSVPSSEKILCRSYLSTDLENINIPDTFNNNDDDKVKKVKITTPTIATSKTASSPTTQTLQTKFNCAFCEKQFPSKNSLKFHVLSHLKSFLKQDTKDDFLASASEVDNAAAGNIDGDASSDFVCVLCEKSFTNKMTLTIHYKVHHQADSQKGSPQNQNRQSASSTSAIHGVSRQSSENKIANTAALGSTLTSTTEESSENLAVDETGGNEDASRQYKCYICDKQFARNSSLMWHIQFHETYMYSKLKKNNTELENGLSPGGGGGTGVDSFPVDADHPFRCQICGKTYESLSGYRRHVANHGIADEEESSGAVGPGEKCELCNKYYSTAVRLKRHIIFMHKDQVPPPVVADMDDIGAVDNATEDCDDSISSSSVSDEYVCNICDRPFTHRNSLKRHMNLIHKMSGDEASSPHQITTSAKCESCGKFFSTSSNMRKHAQKCCKRITATTAIVEEDDDTSKDPVGEFVCDICHRSFCSQRALSIHRAHQHRADLSDSVASDTVASDTTINDLIPIDSYIEKEEGGFQCTVCDKIFESRKGVIRHIGYHRSALNAQAGVRNTSVDSASDDDVDNDDEDEEEDSIPEDSIPCSVCGKTFRSIRGMRIHANSHRETALNDDEDDDDADSDAVNESSFECNICSETFEGFRSFKVHIGWHRRRGEEADVPRKKPAKSTHMPKPAQSGPGKIHQCQHCPRWYTTQQALAGHMKAHQPQKAASSQGSDQLRPTASSGKTSKTYMCQVCGQHFPNSSGLSGHMKSHVGEGVTIPTTSSGQPLTLDDTMECDMCGKFFMRKQDMAKHMRDHMSGAVTKENVDLNLFRCIYCQKSFVGRKSLNTHQILHEEAQVALKRAADQLLTGASPAKQRRQSESTTAVQEDLIGWDDLQAHQCEECDRRLSTKQSLRRHMEWHAKMRAANGSSAPPAKEKDVVVVAAPPPPQKESAGILFECLYCKKCFRNKELLVEHTRIHEDVSAEGPPTVVVNDLEALGEHAAVQCIEGGNEEYFVFEQREGEAYQCSECDETHFDKLQMIVHMAYHVGKRWANGNLRSLIIKMDPIMLAPFECMFCNERFVNKTFRSRHVLKRHGDDVQQCDSCKKLFLSKKKLAVHCQRHFGDSIYRCEHCLKGFTSKWFLKRHARKKCSGKSSPEKKEVNC